MRLRPNPLFLRVYLQQFFCYIFIKTSLGLIYYLWKPMVHQNMKINPRLQACQSNYKFLCYYNVMLVINQDFILFKTTSCLCQDHFLDHDVCFLKAKLRKCRFMMIIILPHYGMCSRNVKKSLSNLQFLAPARILQNYSALTSFTY